MQRLTQMLLRWKQGDEDDGWSQKAEEALIKRLQKESRESPEILRRVLDSQGSDPGPCLKITRSVDGRLQIAHRKIHPHVTSCRIFRWPDLQSHNELKAIAQCTHSFESNLKLVCINPYHYERVYGVNVLPPVLVPRYNESPLPELMEGGEYLYTDQQMPNKIARTVQYTEVPFEHLENWASIYYYEMNDRLGSARVVSSQTFEINGFTDPTPNPNVMSLGLFSNVNRNQPIINARRQIGRGVRLTYTKPFKTLYVECLSNSNIHVHSRFQNYVNGFNLATVYKIQKGRSIMIFDVGKFGEFLSNCANQCFNQHYDLRNMAIIQMSFVKGWGSECQSQDVTSTPCWVEIHLHEPLSWIDRVLSKMGPSTDPISSMS